MIIKERSDFIKWRELLVLSLLKEAHAQVENLALDRSSEKCMVTNVSVV